MIETRRIAIAETPGVERVYLSEINELDVHSYVHCFNTREIYETTLRIPFPYTEIDARAWVNHVAERTAHFGHPINWAIRRASDSVLIGGIGFVDFQSGSHRAEIGYWLAREYWGKGIMSRVVNGFSEYTASRHGLVRLTGCVFAHNIASARVLEKSGYEFEGVLRQHYKKDGRIFDGRLYSRIFD